MTDLKPFYDRAQADSAEVIRLQNEINTEFNKGTDEGIQAAIDLQPQLEAAVKKADDSNKLYISMRNAENTNSSAAASLFVSTEANTKLEEKETVTLAAYNAMVPKDRLAFVLAGGKVTG